MTNKRVLIGKPGLDGHDRGAKFIARALRDQGFEVVYTGIRRTPEEIAAAAVQEDVACVGLSSLSGAHLRLFPAVVEALRNVGAGDIPVLGGGVIPEEDGGVISPCFRMGIHAQHSALGVDLVDLLFAGSVPGELGKVLSAQEAALLAEALPLPLYLWGLDSI